MANPWVALPTGTDVGALARQVRAAREGFLTTGRLDATLRTLVAESWRRCLERRTSPLSGPVLDLSDAELQEYRARHPLASAMPVVRRLLVEDAEEAGFVVAVTDAEGRLLWVEGSPGSRRRAEGIGFVEGADWSERTAGTNAPGTALTVDHPVQIFAAEHFADPVTAWSCSAAPIHAPDGTLLGAIDLTGGNEIAAAPTLTLVRAAAAAMEAELRLHRLNAETSPASRRPAPTVGSPGQVHLLGTTHGVLVTPTERIPLRLRHAEILLLLTLNPAGLTADQLLIELHDRATAAVTLRAELSRLRDLLARHSQVRLGSRPYRLLTPLGTDVATVRQLLDRGAYRRALAAYPGPVLPESVAPGVEVIRERLRRELRSCLIASGDPDLLWNYAHLREAADDLEIWEACGHALPRHSRRRPVVDARIQQLHEDFA